MTKSSSVEIERIFNSGEYWLVGGWALNQERIVVVVRDNPWSNVTVHFANEAPAVGLVDIAKRHFIRKASPLEVLASQAE